MFPRSDARDALLTLQRRQELDVRLVTGDPQWLADHLYDYFTQRSAGLGHDAALNATLAGADLTLGSPAPVPVPLPKPEPSVQPLEDLVAVADTPGVFTEMRSVIQEGRDAKVGYRWVWKGVGYPKAFSQFQPGKPEGQDLDLILAWARGLGANTLVTDPPVDPGGQNLTEFLAAVSARGLRVYWTGVDIDKPAPKPQVTQPLGPQGLAGEAALPAQPPEPAITRQPLDAPSVIAVATAPPTVAPATPDAAFWAGARSVWESGGATLDASAGRPTTELAQRIAEWFFRGLSCIPPDSRDWTPVSPGPGFPLVHDPAWGDALGRVNGQASLVLLIGPPADRQILPQAPWRIVTVAGPANSLIECRS